MNMRFFRKRRQSKNKYKNTKITIDGFKFDSKKEAKRYSELLILKKSGVITDLELQKKFELNPGFKGSDGKKYRAITYIADFFYMDNNLGKRIVEDVKGFKTEVYKIKKKLLISKLPESCIFREI